MGIFHKGGRWGFAWICEGGHRTKRMVDPEQPESGGTSTLRCCRCTRTVDVPMKLLAE